MRVPADALLLLGGLLLLVSLWGDAALFTAGLLVAAAGVAYRFCEDTAALLWPNVDRKPLWAVSQALLWIGVCGWILMRVQ